MRPPEPQRLAAHASFASRVLPWYGRARLWPREPVIRRSMRASYVLPVLSARVRELCESQLRKRTARQDS
eukprot:2348365-Prymnesium_polylepis.1